MKSFGLWYKKKDGKANCVLSQSKPINAASQAAPASRLLSSALGRNKGATEPKIDLHVNLWFLGDIQRKSSRESFLDIGLKIENYNQIEKLTFHCPFQLTSENISDLSEKLNIKENANIIFNEDCEIETKDSYTIVNLSKESSLQSLLVFPLDQAISDIFILQESEDADKTNLVFDFTRFSQYVEKVDRLNTVDNIYIRFRIQNIDLEGKIYFDSELLNKSFESAFSGTRVIDFKINETRNIGDRIRAKILIEDEIWAQLNKVHFLVVEPSSYDLTSFSDDKMVCRELEEKMWDDYLGTAIDPSKGHALAYHWKQGEPQPSFSCLVKVKYSKARWHTILAYSLIVIGLGIISSTITDIVENRSSLTTWLFPDGFASIIAGAVFIVAGLALNRWKK